MLKRITAVLVLSVVLFCITSCEVIGSIFKAGMGFGIIIIVVVIAIIAYVIRKLGGNK